MANLDLALAPKLAPSTCTLHHGDCLEVMPTLESRSVAMVFADLPYGMVNAGFGWDIRIDLPSFWQRVGNIVTHNAAVVCTATQPFTTLLIASNLKNFLYNYVWKKNCATNFFNAKTQPLKNHEDIAVFGNKVKRPTYNPQKTYGHKTYCSPKKEEKSPHFRLVTRARIAESKDGSRYPVSVQHFDRVASKQVMHPTQKPVALLEWLIKTYTNEGDTVLDPVMGSGTTGVACAKLGRNFIGIEKDAAYFEVASKRIADERRQLGLC